MKRCVLCGLVILRYSGKIHRVATKKESRWRQIHAIYMDLEDLCDKPSTLTDDVVPEGKCVKCPEPAKYAGVDPKKAAYCRPCFIQMVKHKFRSTLSKRRVFKDGESRDVMILYDFSPSSAFLLYQIDDALQQKTFKRLVVDPTVIVLLTLPESRDIAEAMIGVKKIRELLPATVPVHVVHLAAAFDKHIVLTENEGRCYGVEQIPVLTELLDSCRSATARDELFRLLKEVVCTKLARSLGISKMMVPDNGDCLGRSTLAQLCIGRGSTVSILSNAVDKRQEITFIRPLRDVNDKEVRIVNRLEGYDSRLPIDTTKVRHQKGSVHSAAADFVDILFNEGFKSTVTTVLSTASKLHTKQHDISCRFCSLAEGKGENDLCPSCTEILDEIGNPGVLLEMFSK